MRKLRELKAALQELIDVMELVPDPDKPDEHFDISGINEAETEKLIKEAIAQIRPDEDVFTSATTEIVEEYKPGKAGKIVQIEEPVQEPEQSYELRPMINDAKKLSELKDIAREYKEFKEIRGRLSSYKTLDDLRDIMLDILDELEKPAPPKKKVEPVAKVEKGARPRKIKLEKEPMITRASVFAEIYNENIPRTLRELEEEMLKRYTKSASEVNARIFTDVYVKLLLELGFINKDKEGKLVKSK